MVVVELSFSRYNDRVPQDFPKKVTIETQVKFEISTSGLYAIKITAQCMRKDDLRVEIDNQFFREIPPEKNIQKYDVPPAWNGTKLKGKSQINIFLLNFEVGEHSVNFIPMDSVQVDEFYFWQVLDQTKIELNLELKAENGNGRPWVTVALINLPLKSIIAEASVTWHLFDGDDVKLIVDNEIEKNAASLLWKDWFWHATPKQIFSGSKREQKTVANDLNKNTHYIEFWADQTPTLHKVILNLGELDSEKPSEDIDQPPSRIPTVDDPKWSGNFEDDTDQIVMARALFGEARNTLVPNEARIAIGWVIKNRVASNSWPSSYWEVITIPKHFSAFNSGDSNRPFVEDPLRTGNEIDQQAWINSYEIAGKVISGELTDPTGGANHYYDDSASTPGWAENQPPTLIISYVNKYGREAKIFFLRL
ncbi:MAG: hypothetical protein COZ34_00085 [Candidatus Pacebacteria bacterium CG_4_10_14_3_um_filter_34_15]|nr:MAG: hypothetical protein COV78_01435 [Candidatus Pacebacteria bacterium CG11_big_fil_rev_8_21_14_0_20_34_55]PIX82065.1 MAG: hypothetical protein COZ34_00085 [Candidatus Pacebacteria bacterium CG_4_10_14_3_um_filter_34_15]PJC43813.1 MAG: hypothetical protein CO039_02160 [Candidatus Pacebacteria bacterium CG_4_9_14_0_2_um_filter_34_50]